METMPDPVREKQLVTLNNNFMYHPPQGDDVKTYEMVRSGAKALALFLNTACPDSREKSLAMTKLEEAVFWANAAIARNPMP